MKRYVLTVPLSQQGQAVVIRKIRGPKGVAYRVNFPGGHIEDGETPEQAAVRELAEETGLQALESQLVPIAYKGLPGEYELFVYALVLDTVSGAQSLTDEQVSVHRAELLLCEAAANQHHYGPDFLTLLALAIEAPRRTPQFITLPG